MKLNGGEIIKGDIVEVFSNQLRPQKIELDIIYEDDDIIVEHHEPSFGMTFVKVKTLDAIARFKEGIDWDKVFEDRNFLNDVHFNRDIPKFVDWNQDIPNIQNELVITP